MIELFPKEDLDHPDDTDSIVKQEKFYPFKFPEWPRVGKIAFATTSLTTIFMAIAFGVFGYFFQNSSSLPDTEIINIAQAQVESLENDSAFECDIKGNINDHGVKIFHLPGDFNYFQIAIDENKGEKYFCSVEAAKKDGFRRTTR